MTKCFTVTVVKNENFAAQTTKFATVQNKAIHNLTMQGNLRVSSEWAHATNQMAMRRMVKQYTKLNYNTLNYNVTSQN